MDYVAHEIGHQLGANHTFSHGLESAGVNVEPGSGSTIMGYAGITGANTDVQPHSDAYFHAVSINQVQNNLVSKTCDIETTINNNPPVIAALSTYNIPKGTAFVLTASATDPENDPLTYCWEQVDNATVTINK
ncbi:reprolysin-like metallopeptidase [Chryseobacterium arachidis]|uniref:reprolysin-like metallopeptidase n=1 Tax=Chryseobacterium arachidis TaxID=1416778 RepID=UPI00360E49A4